jgi:CxxC motif-containing protein
MNIKELTCIGCPLGCNLEIEINNNKIINIKGHSCKRGLEYGEKECTNPTRILTTTVKVIGGESEVVAVKTEKDISKKLIVNCIGELKKVKINAPVHIGDVILYDILNTGVNIIATMNVDKIAS